MSKEKAAVIAEKKPPKKYKLTTWDENTGKAIGVTTYKKIGNNNVGRTFYQTSYKPFKNKKSIKKAINASDLGRNKKTTSSKAKAPSINSNVGAGCFDGGKDCRKE